VDVVSADGAVDQDDEVAVVSVLPHPDADEMVALVSHEVEAVAAVALIPHPESATGSDEDVDSSCDDDDAKPHGESATGSEAEVPVDAAHV
jgi:hypothetical protein